MNDWDFDYRSFGHQQLKDYLFPNVGRVKHVADTKHKQIGGVDEIHQSMHKLNRNKSFEFGGKSYLESNSISERTFGSEEISDQDIGCQREMSKFANNWRCIRENANLMNISQFSIEPSSSPSDNDSDTESKRKSKPSGILTLSLNEDSCNAVDLPMSARKCDAAKGFMADLSFNGKISNEITQTSVIGGNGPMANGDEGNKNEVDVANTSSRSNLEILQLETSREMINEQSPDIFADDDDYDDTFLHTAYVYGKDNDKETSTYFADDSLTSTNNEEKEVKDADVWDRKEKATSRRIQNLLSGVLPPPSITFCQLDIENILTLHKANSEILKTTDVSSDSSDSGFGKNDFIPDGLNEKEWPHVRNASEYGVHYNRTKYSDNIEIMYMKLAERHIGHETSSSFTFDASANTVKKPVRKM